MNAWTQPRVRVGAYEERPATPADPYARERSLAELAGWALVLGFFVVGGGLIAAGVIRRIA